MARRECAMAALFPAERIGGLASLQPATLRLAADVRYGGHSRRSDGQQGFAECPLCLQWRPNLCVATNRRDAISWPSSALSRLLAHIEKSTIVGTTLGGAVHVWRGNIHARTQDD